MHIAVPAETSPGELRVALTPDSVARLVKAGHVVRIHAGAPPTGDAPRVVWGYKVGVVAGCGGGGSSADDSSNTWSPHWARIVDSCSLSRRNHSPVVRP